MSTILDTIVADARRRLEIERPDRTQLERDARHAIRGNEPHRFAAALARAGEVNIIAEIKAASPSAGAIVEDIDPARLARLYRHGGAAAVSVVTEPIHFRGDRSWLKTAAAASDLPVIMKDFVVDPVQLFEGVAAGASAILLLASILDAVTIRAFIQILDDLGVDALVEVHDEEELDRALASGAKIIGINNRDLRDFSISLETGERLVQRIPSDRLRVAESGIESHGDIERLQRAGFNAFLIGTSLLRSGDPESALRRLRGAVHV